MDSLVVDSAYSIVQSLPLVSVWPELLVNYIPLVIDLSWLPFVEERYLAALLVLRTSISQTGIYRRHYKPCWSILSR